MLNWIVETKLRPPLEVPGQIARDRVTQSLDKVLSGGVGILHAPAGYGKSTTLATWHSQLLDERTPAAWLNLDEGDQSLNTFLSYLMVACRQSGFDVFEPFSDLDLGAIPEDEAAQACFTALSRLESQHALILDDFHRAASEPVQRFINRLCHSQPKDLGLVISTREVPMHALLADLRVSGRLVEITQRELGFSRAEVSSLLSAQNAGPTLREDWVADVERRTEGWPVAVASVMRWLSQGFSSTEVLQRLSGREKVLSEYFLEQAFQELSTTDQSFLLATSILERVNGDIAQALCPDIDGWETLNRLEHQDAFVLRADNEGNWYRYHRLYAEFLAQIRHRSSNFDDQALHKAAADWFSEHRFLPEAVQHTTATGDVLRCAELLESLGGWQYALRGDLALVQSTLKKLSISNLIGFPRLWLARIYLSVRIGHHRAGIEDLKRYLVEIESSLTDDPVLRSETTLIETLVQRYTDSPVTRSNIDRLERLADDLPPDNDVLQAVRSNFLCAMYREVADYRLSESHAKSAILHYQAMDAAYAEAFIYYHQGLASMRQARFSTAEKEYTEGLAIALRLFGDDSDLAAIGQIFIAECHLEAARVDHAKSLLDRALPHAERADAWLEVYASGYGTLLRIAYATSDPALIERVITRAQQTATRRQLPRLGVYIRLLDLDLRLRQPTEQASAQADVPLDSAVEWDQVSHQLRTACATRELMLQGRFDEAKEALLPAWDESKQTGFFRAYLQFSLLLATIEWARGEAQAAFEAFESAVSIAIVENARLVFVEDAQVLSPILNGILDEDAAVTIAPARMSYLRQLRADMQESMRTVDAQPSPLSARELQILRCLMMGESNREIATGKSVSINTVKFHLKNIFSKLGASSRDEAVAFAIRDQLI